MMEAEAKFCALLICISKLFSRKNVEELAFITSKDINNRQLSEEIAESGNALKLFQAMCDRGLYTHDNPSLLLQHLIDIGRSDAVRMLQQEMGASSLNYRSADEHVLISRNQEKALGIPTVKIAPVSDHLYPSLLLEKGQQEISLPLDRTPTPAASTSQPNDDFKDRVGYPGTATFPCSHECAAGTKILEPEASLRGDANSPRFPDIPERPNQRGSRDNKGSSGTYFKFPEPEKTHEAVAAPQGHPDMPQHPPPCGSANTSSSSAGGFGSSWPERSHMCGNTPAGNCIPEQLPQGSNGNDGSHLKAAYNLTFPVPASEEISVAAVPQQTVHAARPDTTMPHAKQLQQPTIGLKRLPQAWGMNEISHPKVEVELLRGRPPPIPERPSRRPEIANFGVQELELCRLSRRFSAGKVDDLGLELGFGDGRISQLKYENPHDISRVFYRLMVEWRSAQHGGSNMRENLANHLRNIDCMELASDLEMGTFS